MAGAIDEALIYTAGLHLARKFPALKKLPEIIQDFKKEAEPSWAPSTTPLILRHTIWYILRSRVDSKSPQMPVGNCKGTK